MVFCDIHRVFYTGDNFTGDATGMSCCSAFFDEVPIYTSQGTCFTSKMRVVERLANVFSGLKFFTSFNNDTYPGLPGYFTLLIKPREQCCFFPWAEYDVSFKASDALDRDGVLYAVSGVEHPVTAVASSPIYAPHDLVTTVALDVAEVTMRLVESCILIE